MATVHRRGDIRERRIIAIESKVVRAVGKNNEFLDVKEGDELFEVEELDYRYPYLKKEPRWMVIGYRLPGCPLPAPWYARLWRWLTRRTSPALPPARVVEES